MSNPEKPRTKSYREYKESLVADALPPAAVPNYRHLLASTSENATTDHKRDGDAPGDGESTSTAQLRARIARAYLERAQSAIQHWRFVGSLGLAESLPSHDMNDVNVDLSRRGLPTIGAAAWAADQATTLSEMAEDDDEGCSCLPPALRDLVDCAAALAKVQRAVPPKKAKKTTTKQPPWELDPCLYAGPVPLLPHAHALFRQSAAASASSAILAPDAYRFDLSFTKAAPLSSLHNSAFEQARLEGRRAHQPATMRDLCNRLLALEALYDSPSLPFYAPAGADPSTARTPDDSHGGALQFQFSAAPSQLCLHADVEVALVMAAMTIRDPAAAAATSGSDVVFSLQFVHDQEYVLERYRRKLLRGYLYSGVHRPASVDAEAWAAASGGLLATCGAGVAAQPLGGSSEALLAPFQEAFRPFHIISFRGDCVAKYLPKKVDAGGGTRADASLHFGAPSASLAGISEADADAYEKFFVEQLAPLAFHPDHAVEALTSYDGGITLCDFILWRLNHLRQHGGERDAVADSAPSPSPSGPCSCALVSNSLALSNARKDKYLMQQALAHEGLMPPLTFARTRRVKSAKEALEVLASEEWLGTAPDGKRSAFPVVLKPVNGAGSEFVSLCYSEADIAATFAVSRGANTTLGLQAHVMALQEYLGGAAYDRHGPTDASAGRKGREYVIDTVSFGGQHVVTDVWTSRKFPMRLSSTRMSQNAAETLEKKRKDRKEGTATAAQSAEPSECEGSDEGEDAETYDAEGKRRQYLTTTFVYDYQDLVLPPLRAQDDGPSSPDTDTQLVVDYTLRVLDALGVACGSAHCEVMLTFPDGADGPAVPKLIELNARPQGDIPRASAVLGTDQFGLLAHIVAFRGGLQARSAAGASLSPLWPPPGMPQRYGTAASEGPFPMCRAHVADEPLPRGQRALCSLSEAAAARRLSSSYRSPLTQQTRPANVPFAGPGAAMSSWTPPMAFDASRVRSLGQAYPCTHVGRGGLDAASCACCAVDPLAVLFHMLPPEASCGNDGDTFRIQSPFASFGECLSGSPAPDMVLRIVFLFSSDDGVVSEPGRRFIRDHLPAFVRFTRAARFVRGPDPGFLTSVTPTMDIFTSPAAVILFGPRAVVDASHDILRYMERNGIPQDSRPADLCHLSTTLVDETLQRIAANTGVPTEALLGTLAVAIEKTPTSTCTSTSGHARRQEDDIRRADLERLRTPFQLTMGGRSGTGPAADTAASLLRMFLLTRTPLAQVAPVVALCVDGMKQVTSTYVAQLKPARDTLQGIRANSLRRISRLALRSDVAGLRTRAALERHFGPATAGTPPIEAKRMSHADQVFLPRCFADEAPLLQRVLGVMGVDSTLVTDSETEPTDASSQAAATEASADGPLPSLAARRQRIELATSLATDALQHLLRDVSDLQRRVDRLWRGISAAAAALRSDLLASAAPASELRLRRSKISIVPHIGAKYIASTAALAAAALNMSLTTVRDSAARAEAAVADFSDSAEAVLCAAAADSGPVDEWDAAVSALLTAWAAMQEATVGHVAECSRQSERYGLALAAELHGVLKATVDGPQRGQDRRSPQHPRNLATPLPTTEAVQSYWNAFLQEVWGTDASSGDDAASSSDNDVDTTSRDGGLTAPPVELDHDAAALWGFGDAGPVHSAARDLRMILGGSSQVPPPLYMRRDLFSAIRALHQAPNILTAIHATENFKLENAFSH